MEGSARVEERSATQSDRFVVDYSLSSLLRCCSSTFAALSPPSRQNAQRECRPLAAEMQKLAMRSAFWMMGASLKDEKSSAAVHASETRKTKRAMANAGKVCWCVRVQSPRGMAKTKTEERRLGGAKDWKGGREKGSRRDWNGSREPDGGGGGEWRGGGGGVGGGGRD
jgi:hypothetical protein